MELYVNVSCSNSPDAGPNLLVETSSVNHPTSRLWSLQCDQARLAYVTRMTATDLVILHADWSRFVRLFCIFICVFINLQQMILSQVTIKLRSRDVSYNAILYPKSC